jgi:hypothetical protein
MVESKWLIRLTCRTLFTSNGMKMVKIGKEWIDDFNLRPGGATRRKWGIFRWEGRGVVCGYSELQGGSLRQY